MKRFLGTTVALAVLAASACVASSAGAGWDNSTAWLEVQSLDGSGNNRAHPDWGRAGTNYLRVAPTRYADGIGAPVAGPNARYLSNRVLNDSGQQLVSPRRVSQWAAVWGQFLDHTFGLRANSGEPLPIPLDPADPLESHHSDLPFIPVARSTAGDGTGVTTPREQPNTVSSYVDAWAVYGGTAERLEWMREGPVDGDPRNNGARLLLPGGLLPRRDARGDAESAPEMDTTGGLEQSGVVAGDIRANENLALTAVQTLPAREHNRIVALLPRTLTEEQRFQIARRVVIATQQYITYEQFLPSLGVRLAPYPGYDPGVNASLGNEFAAPQLPHRENDPRRDLDLASYAVVRSYDDGHWEPKRLCHALAQHYED
jgi:heme peroxidase